MSQQRTIRNREGSPDAGSGDGFRSDPYINGGGIPESAPACIPHRAPTAAVPGECLATGHLCQHNQLSLRKVPQGVCGQHQQTGRVNRIRRHATQKIIAATVGKPDKAGLFNNAHRCGTIRFIGRASNRTVVAAAGRSNAENRRLFCGFDPFIRSSPALVPLSLVVAGLGW